MNVGIFAHQLPPHVFTVVVLAHAEAGGAIGIALRDARIVHIGEHVRDNDRVFVLVGLQDAVGPGQSRIARGKLQHHDQIIPSVDTDHAVKILIAPSGKTSFVPGRAGITPRPKERVEIPGRRRTPRGIVLIVIVIADRHHVRNVSIEQAHRSISVLPLRGHAAAIHNISQADHQLDVLVLHVIGNPLRLRGKYLRIK